MRKALLLIRDLPHYRRDAFLKGLAGAGFAVATNSSGEVRADDLLVIWNRYGSNDTLARIYERAGAGVMIAENGYFGVCSRFLKPYSLHWNMLHGYGSWHIGAEDRWAPLGIPLQPWRDGGKEVIVFEQRGIGVPPVRSTQQDAIAVAETIRHATGLPVRIRKHPGNRKPEVPLEEDLRRAAFVVCHTSAAGLHAMILGVPVVTTAEKWFGLPAATYNPAGLIGGWSCVLERLRRNDAERLNVFQRIAWAQWTVDEITSGVPFRFMCT